MLDKTAITPDKLIIPDHLKTKAIQQNEAPKRDIYIGIPRERIYIPAFIDNRDDIIGYLKAVGRYAGHFDAEGHRVDKNRDAIVEQFLGLEHRPEWLLMLDSDMEHPITIGERLVRHNKPVVGGLYFHRGEGHAPFAFKRVPDREDKWGRKKPAWAHLNDEVYDFLMAHHAPMTDGPLMVDQLLMDPLLSCDAVATGAMLVHRDVFELMEPPWFEYPEHGFSEDMWFCKRVRDDHRLPVYCDMSTISGHYTWVPMGQAQFRQLYETRGLNLSSYTKREAATWLSEFLDLDFDSAVERIESSNAAMVGEYWNDLLAEKGEIKGEDIHNFYLEPETGYLYLLELLHWNFTWTFAAMRQTLVHLRDQNILEIGAGIGTVATQLLIQNNNVLAVEPNKTLREFIAYRWNKLQPELYSRHGELLIDQGRWLVQSPDESFDAVVSFDTFEHMEMNILTQNVSNAARVLKPGGRLFYHNNFGQQDIYPMHFNYEAVWPSILKQAGLLEVSPYAAVKAN